MPGVAILVPDLVAGPLRPPFVYAIDDMKPARVDLSRHIFEGHAND